MDKLYLRGVSDGLKSVLIEFDNQCRSHGINYTIITDEPTHQRFILSVESINLALALRNIAARNNIIIENVGMTLDFAQGRPHAEENTYNLDLVDDDVRFKIGEAAIGYLGQRHGPMIRENMQGLAVPIKPINTETLWQTHLNHPRYAELGDDKACYVGVIDNFPPLVVDTLDEGAPVKHAGVLLDGFRRLYASYYRQEPSVKAIDVADIISGIQSRIGIATENSHKSILSRKYSKTMDECSIGEVGKLNADLLAHDNKTTIPKGAVVKVVDGDASLPDVKFDGKIVNVDRDALEDVWKPASFQQQLDFALVESKEPVAEAEKSEFENSISTILGTISIVEPEILFTIRPK